MKRAGVVTLVVLGTFGFVFVCQVLTMPNSTSAVAEGWLVGTSCGSVITPITVCETNEDWRCGTGPDKIDPPCGPVIPENSSTGYTAGGAEWGEAYTNGSVNCPSFTAFRCKEKVFLGSPACILEDDTFTYTPGGTYTGIAGSC